MLRVMFKGNIRSLFMKCRPASELPSTIQQLNRGEYWECNFIVRARISVQTFPKFDYRFNAGVKKYGTKARKTDLASPDKKLNHNKIRKQAVREDLIASSQKKSKASYQESSVLYVADTKPGEKKDISRALPDTYSPLYTEAAWYDWWESQGYFKPQDASDKEPFVICLPPPNVTGHLHLGHALGNSIQDAIVRWHRMRGRRVLWNPGMDHAGIATQVRVERHLQAKEGVSRHEIGREAFTEKVWQWKREKGSKISEQMRQLGSSLDWSRDCFTLDPKMCRAVQEAFIRLYDEGLIHRNKRMVNWSCALKSGISDLEVEYAEITGRKRIPVPGYERPVLFGVLIDFAFPVIGEDAEIVVSTTRPETLLGDMAVAVHPNDVRYTSLHGKQVQHPLCDRTLPIICDESVDPKFGTGAVKVTPGHDFNDFERGQGHDLPMLDILTDDGLLINMPPPFQGMPRFKARGAVVQALKEHGLYRGEKPHSMRVPLCSRSGDVIEPRVKNQWFLDCREMAQNAVNAVDEGRLELIPGKSYNKHWKMWLESKASSDWCISRQLWWGHQIPAYQIFRQSDMESLGWVCAHDKDGAVKKACDWLKCKTHDITLEQDPDVLDTWFSSALFPFAIFGWPEKTADLADFYPTHLLETASDIIFFWVARMVMLGEKLTGQLPFKQVLFHGIMQDRHGRKMSKSLGNVIDPMHIIHGISLENLHASLEKESFSAAELEKAKAGQMKDFPLGIPQCGSDALRFTMCNHRFKAHNVNVDIYQLENNRRLCNKIWQSFKLIESLLGEQSLRSYTLHSFNAKDSAITATDRWALSHVSQLVTSCDSGFHTYDLYNATEAIDHFWRQLSAVYLDYAKLQLAEGNEASKTIVRQILHICTDTGLRAMAPFMPFLAEELYQRLPLNPDLLRAESVTIAAYPDPNEYSWSDESLVEEMKLVRQYGDHVVTARSDLLLKKPIPNSPSAVFIQLADPSCQQVLETHMTALRAFTSAHHIGFKFDQSQGGRYLRTETACGNHIQLQVPDNLDITDQIKKVEANFKRLEKKQQDFEKKLQSNKIDEPSRIVLTNKSELNQALLKRTESVLEAYQNLSS